MIPTNADLEHALADVPADTAAKIRAFAAPCVRLVSTPTEDEDIPIGASKFGGAPDLPPGMEWPQNDSKPLAFLAQINLAELAKHDVTSSIPTSGLLTFFYDHWKDHWGFDPSDRGCWLVRCLNESELERRPPPPDTMGEDSDSDRWTACAVEFRSAISLAGWERDDVQSSLSEHEQKVFDDVTERVMGDGDNGGGGEDCCHQILGYLCAIQQPHIDQDCILASSGFDMGGAVENPDIQERMEQTLRAADDWDLILQLDTDDEGPGWMWGDMGMLYFYAPRSEIAKGNFKSTWCVLQCG